MLGGEHLELGAGEGKRGDITPVKPEPRLGELLFCIGEFQSGNLNVRKSEPELVQRSGDVQFCESRRVAIGLLGGGQV